jgi:hypothetical protein
MKAYFKYFFDVNLFNFIYSVLISVILLNIVYIPIVFATVGTFTGLLSYKYFHNNEYYFYYNLGFSQKRLFLTTWILNIIIATILYLSIN